MKSNKKINVGVVFKHDENKNSYKNNSNDLKRFISRQET